MALPWQCHGNAMAISWHCHGNAMALPRQCHGIAMAIAMALPWQCHGIAMAQGSRTVGTKPNRTGQHRIEPDNAEPNQTLRVTRAELVAQKVPQKLARAWLHMGRGIPHNSTRYAVGLTLNGEVRGTRYTASPCGTPRSTDFFLSKDVCFVKGFMFCRRM